MKHLRYIIPVACLVAAAVWLSAFSTVEKKTTTYTTTSNNTWVHQLLKEALSAPYRDEVAEYYDEVFKRFYKKGRLNGTVLVGEKGKILYKGAFGYGDLRKKEPLEVEAAFQLASVSKMFTAAAIMQLKEAGELNYNDDIRKHLDFFPYEGITIRNLLNHNSGLPRYMSVAHDEWDKELPLSNKDMLDLMVQCAPGPYFSPGRMFNYLNVNYALLSVIVEAKTGIAFEDYLKQNIFEPLDMQNAFVYVNDGVRAFPDEVKGYELRRRRYRSIQDDYLNGVTGDKGVYASVEDLYKFDRALYSDDFLKKETVAEAYKPGNNRFRRGRDDYGFGWRLKPGSPQITYHYGWWKGFKACFIRDLDNERAIIILNNRTVSPSFSWFMNDIQEWDKHFHEPDLPATLLSAN